MKRFSKFLMLGMTLALVIGVVALPAFAQDEAPGPGLGGTVVEGNIGGDASTFVPFLVSDNVSSQVTSKMFPDLVGIDPVTLEYSPNVAQAMAAGWEYDETGTILTLSLREDIFWSDGTPITAADYVWAFNAVKSGLTSSARTSLIWQLDDGTVSEGFVHELTQLDDYTLQFRLGVPVRDENGEPVVGEDGNIQLNAACDAITEIGDISPVPAHIYEARFGDDYASIDADKFFVPRTDDGLAVTWGPFTDPFTEFGVQVSLLADPNYTDGQLGFVSPGEWLMQNVESTTIEYERFLAGDFTFMGIPSENQNAFRETGVEDGYSIVEYQGTSINFLSFNIGDPTNPQPGKDEAGNLIDQGFHPIFGDVRVRQAAAYGANVAEMIGTRPEGDNPATGILEGNGYPVATNSSPYATNLAELEALGVAPREYNPELAIELLEEAGWVDNDGDGVRECSGCLYAEEGAPLEFDLLTNAGNPVRESIGETVRAQLSEIGFVVNFQAIEFGTLVSEILSQETDAIIIGFTGYGAPYTNGSSLKLLFSAGNDIPGSAFNWISYSNQEFEDLLALADALPAAEDGSYPACDPATRQQLYAEAEAMLFEDQAYLWLFFANSMFAVQPNVAGNDMEAPYPLTDLDSWYVLEN